MESFQNASMPDIIKVPGGSESIEFDIGRTVSRPSQFSSANKICLSKPEADCINSEPTSVMIVGASGVGKSTLCNHISIFIFRELVKTCHEALLGYHYEPVVLPDNIQNMDSLIKCTDSGNYMALVEILDDTNAVSDEKMDPRSVAENFHAMNEAAASMHFNFMNFKQLKRRPRVRLETKNRFASAFILDSNLEAISRRYDVVIVAKTGDDFRNGKRIRIFKGDLSQLAKLGGETAKSTQMSLDMISDDFFTFTNIEELSKMLAKKVKYKFELAKNRVYNETIVHRELSDVLYGKV